jgi:phage portal protein BeeE
MENYLQNFKEWFSEFWSGKTAEQSFFQSTASRLIGRVGPAYLDTSAPYKLYNSIPQLRTIIDRKALMFANMVIIMVDKNGKEVEDPDLKRLLDRPNVLQGQNDFLRQFKQQEQIYGNQFIYKNKASRVSTYPQSLQNITPFLLKPNLTGKLFDQIAMDGLVKNYQYIENGTEKTFKTDEILWSRINDLDSPLVGISPLKALRFPLTNIKYAYDYRNVLLNEKGAIGILSAMPAKDAQGALPMDKEEKKRLNDSYSNTYGIGTDNEGGQKSRIQITDTAMNWQPMTFPTKDLLLFEEIDANTLTLVDHFGLNINIFSSKSQTYENVKNAIIQCYQDTIQPEADQYVQNLGEFLGIKEGYKLKASYDHLAILQSDQAHEASTFATIMSTVTQSVTAGILDAAQASAFIAKKFGIVLDLTNAKLPTVNVP